MTLNRAVAVAETKGPETGLALLDGVVEELDGYHLLHASRGSMLERLGRTHEAGLEYDRAAALARTETDMSFLSRRRTELTVDHPAGPAWPTPGSASNASTILPDSRGEVVSVSRSTPGQK